MLGSIAGCTQPISSNTLRGCERVGHWCARAGARAGTLSFSAVGSCYDNAAVESFFATLKRELAWIHATRT
jgi:transposase InsO family protein